MATQACQKEAVVCLIGRMGVDGVDSDHEFGEKGSSSRAGIEIRDPRVGRHRNREPAHIKSV